MKTPSGALQLTDLATRSRVAVIDLGSQPDPTEAAPNPGTSP